MAKIDHPFDSALPEHVHLPRAPLVRVVAQVHFPFVAYLAGKIGEIQAAVQKDYPSLEFDGASGHHPDSSDAKIWRFSDFSETWRLSLAHTFVAVETSSYTTKEDFLRRFRFALEMVAKYLDPQIVERIGLRYIDRIQGSSYSRLSELIRSELLAPDSSVLEPYLLHSLNQSSYAIRPEVTLSTRWGILAPKQSYDVESLLPIDEKSWVLDLDLFSTKKSRFEVESILGTSNEFADMIYRFFRWAVTQEFLTEYGAEV